MNWRGAGYWTFPSLVALTLYWPGLWAWFQKDDFAWLGLRAMVHSWGDLWRVLFAPMAQGTIRTLSERVFYLTFTSVFGLHPLPFRIWVLLTGFATLVVLCAVCTRLTRSPAAGFWAAVLWAANSGNAYVFSWTAIYYELLCSLFFLCGLWLLIRYAETGDRHFYRAQWATYLLGFLVLELNVVYPALASLYALCCARGILRKVSWTWLPAGAYAMLHVSTAPLQPSGPYRMFWDASVLSTFWTYWKWALGPNRLIYAGIQASAGRSVMAAALMAGLLGFLAWTVYKRQWLTLFMASWFVIVLAPLLPLRDHVSDYYLTVPTIGLAMWGGFALVRGWLASVETRVAAVLLLVVYLGVNMVVGRISSGEFYRHSQRIHKLVDGVVALAPAGKQVVLQGVSEDLMVDAVRHRVFRLYLNEDVLVMEDAGQAARAALREGRAVLLDGSGETVRLVRLDPVVY